MHVCFIKHGIFNCIYTYFAFVFEFNTSTNLFSFLDCVFIDKLKALLADWLFDKLEYFPLPPQ